ncbi:hypothetical protein K3740_06660 [Ruegeria conchae]|nr:hypothetical protein [Ruegeria conchae]UWR04357.1 hypothetical protein K3740_06660 [Ruegeria conchae]
MESQLLVACEQIKLVSELEQTPEMTAHLRALISEVSGLLDSLEAA